MLNAETWNQSKAAADLLMRVRSGTLPEQPTYTLLLVEGDDLDVFLIPNSEIDIEQRKILRKVNGEKSSLERPSDKASLLLDCLFEKTSDQGVSRTPWADYQLKNQWDCRQAMPYVEDQIITAVYRCQITVWIN